MPIIPASREEHQRREDDETLCSEAYVCDEVLLADADGMVTSNITLSDILVQCSTRNAESTTARCHFFGLVSGSMGLVTGIKLHEKWLTRAHTRIRAIERCNSRKLYDRHILTSFLYSRYVVQHHASDCLRTERHILSYLCKKCKP